MPAVLRAPMPRLVSPALLRALVMALALIVTLPPTPASAQAPPGHLLAGRVIDASTGEGVDGASVRLTGSVHLGAVTDRAGRWHFERVPSGAYTLRIEHLAYAPAERRVSVPGPGVQVAAGSHGTGASQSLHVAITRRPVALDALVVTAGRRVQRLADVAVPTELVTAREIRESGASDLASVLTERAGVELQGGHPVGAGVMLQGLDSERVLVLLDGQPFIGRISGMIDVSRIPTSMIERVEVVKGPQSTTYGSEAMGGVVNVITRSPDASAWTTAAGFTTGNRGRMDVTGNVVGGAGDVAGLLDVGRRSVSLTPGWAGTSGAESSRWDALARMSWNTPFQGMRVEASGLVLDERQRWRSGQLFHFADNLQWSARAGGRLERGRHRLSTTFLATAFEHLSRRATGEEPVPGTGESETQRLFEGELLYGLELGAQALDVGLEARREAIHSDRVAGGRRTDRTLESFAQATVTIGPVTLVPGLRASWSDPWGTHWTPRIAAMVRPVPEVAIRISGGEGFRAPSFKETHMEFLNVGPGFGYTVRGNPELRPEVSRNVTASVEWAGARTHARAQIFRNRFDNFIETRPVGDSSGITIHTYGNVDDGFTRGAEVEGGVAWRGWRAEGGLSLLRAERSGTGEPLLGRPARSARGTVGYAHPAGLRISLTGVHTGRTPMRRTDTGTDDRDAFLRFDTRIAVALPAGLEVVAGVDNVLDARPDDWPGFTGRHLYTGLSWRAAGSTSDNR